MGQAALPDIRIPFGTALPAPLSAAVLERINDIVMVTEAGPFDEPGPRVLYVNPAFERLTGYPAAEALGRSPRFLQGPGTSAQEVQRIDDALRARRPMRAELLNYRKDGTAFWVEMDASFMRSPAADAEFVVFIERDITERKNAEQALLDQGRSIASVFSNLPGMAYRCHNDAAWTMEFVSDGCRRLTGYDPVEVVGNRVVSFEDIIHPEDRRAVREFDASTRERNGAFELAYRIRTRDGVTKWVQEQGRSIPGPDGATAHFEGFITDITERKLLESQLIQNQRLESIGTLAGGIAHDLNNVLAPIMMAGDLLADEVSGPEALQLLDAVKANARRGAELVRQILLFARGMEGPRVAVDPVGLLGEMRAFLEGTLPKSIRVEVGVAPGTAAISGDPAQLHQLLLNLCVNARDAMPDGGRLSVTARQVSVSPSAPRPHPDAVPGDFVRIDVADTGSGIPDILKGQIFDPFFTTKGVGRGSGLGLSTARSIVKAHGGFITFVSSTGSGTTFSLHLPVADASLATAERGESAAAAAGPPARGRGEHILVVDDEDSVRQIMRSSLEHFGFRVSTASGGTEALKMARAAPGPFALAIVDLQMPDMDGSQTIAVLRRLQPGLPVVAASGFAAGRAREEASAGGVRHFLDKPFTVETLVHAAHAAMAAPAP